MRLVFCGTPQFAVPSLKSLLAQADIKIAAVITQPDRPKGRGREISQSPVKQVALEAGGTLTAVRQNLETAAAEALEARGRTVNVAWRENQTYDIHNESRAPSARSEGDSQ